MRALQYTVGSPFARTIRILMDELELDYVRTKFRAAPSRDDSDRSPTSRSRPFWDGDFVLWDSGLIAEYLLTTYPRRPAAAPPLAANVWRPSFALRDKLVSTSARTLVASITTISQLTWTGVCRWGQRPSRPMRRSGCRPCWRASRRSSRITDPAFIPGTLAVQDIFFVSGIRFAEARPIGVEFAWSRYPRLYGADQLALISAPASWRTRLVVGTQRS